VGGGKTLGNAKKRNEKLGQRAVGGKFLTKQNSEQRGGPEGGKTIVKRRGGGKIDEKIGKRTTKISFFWSRGLQDYDGKLFLVSKMTN